MNDVAKTGGPTRLADLYRQMFLIRRVEEEAARAYAKGKIGGFLHLYIGQEAVARRRDRRARSRTTTSSRRTATTASPSPRA